MKKNEILEKADFLRNVQTYVDFFALWMSFNTYYNDLCEDHIRRERDRVLESLLPDPEIVQAYRKLAQDGKIFEEFSDIPFRHMEKRTFVPNIAWPNKPGYFDKDVHNLLKDFLETIYTIRCNLFHGDKTSCEVNVEKLVRWATKWLKELLRS